jgi:hypothetical protein
VRKQPVSNVSLKVNATRSVNGNSNELRSWYLVNGHRIIGVTLATVALAVASTPLVANAVNKSSTSPASGIHSTIPAPLVKTAQKVVFTCTGSAPGVTISYGSDSSNHAASRPPFTVSLPLGAHAMYYSISAQLGGSGSIRCSVTVHWNQNGRSHSAVKIGSASGGYNIADPEVCSNFTGGWQAC